MVKKWKERKKLSFAYMQDQKKLGTIRIYFPELGIRPSWY